MPWVIRPLIPSFLPPFSWARIRRSDVGEGVGASEGVDSEGVGVVGCIAGDVVDLLPLY
jgi:hypothetical protein